MARAEDAAAINRLRLAVRENVLADPSWLTEERTVRAITETGRGWIAEASSAANSELLGFSIAEQDPPSIWALFVHPDHEGQGIGKVLLGAAVEWLFATGAEAIELSTEPGTRAAEFYRRQGWESGALNAKGEICFVRRRGSPC